MSGKNSSKNLNERNREELEKASFSVLKSFMLLIKGIFLLCCGIFMYLLFGDSVSLDFKPTLSQAEYEAIKKERRTPDRGDIDRVEKGIHVQTGLVYADGFDIVRATCTACHSAKLVTQNRATREGWQQMIRWMQAKQGLWDLGKSEPVILDYLAKYYAPKEEGRRQNLDVAAIEWFILELEE